MKSLTFWFILTPINMKQTEIFKFSYLKLKLMGIFRYWAKLRKHFMSYSIENIN